jgi:hypothetical protein
MPEAATPPADPAKIKTRKPRQRACDEKDAKSKICAGHLKRYYDYPKEIAAVVGQGAEIYRCHRCGTLYQPLAKELPRSYVLRY